MTDKSEDEARCQYCGSRFAPSPEKPDFMSEIPTDIPMGDVAKKAATPVIVILVVAALFTAGIAMAVFFLVTDTGIEGMAQTLAEEPAFAEEVQRVGGEGTGAGKFTDNRELGIDGKGRIYCADYSGERLQVFNADGTFNTQWFIPKMPVQDLCVSRDGIVYICQQAQISAYDGATGKLLDKTDRGMYGNMTLLLDGSLVAARMDGGIAKLDRDLQETQTYEDVMQKAGAESPMTAEMASNGPGEIFLLDFMGENVYHFSPELVFIDRFKTKGMIPNHMAVDDKGRIFVSSVTEINIYTNEGEFVGSFPSKQAFGMAFDDKGHVWVADRPYLVKYKINE